MDLASLTIAQIHEGLKNKNFSATELTEAFLSKIKERDGEIHAYLNVMEESAKKQAREVDKKIAAGEEIGILEGAPCAIKDNILIRGEKCTSGSKILEHYVAPYDAEVIKKLKEKGVVFLGKTNLDEFAMGSSTENSAFFPTKNPWDKEYVPGGSSSGSAVSVASDMCIASTGTDTGGSIRLPASFNNVVGLKPTYGRVSRYGVIAMGSSLDSPGILSKNVTLSAKLLKIITGKDENDATTSDNEVSDYELALTGNIKGIKISSGHDIIILLNKVQLIKK